MRHGIQKTVSTEYDGSTLYHFLREGMGLAKKEISRAKFLEDGICVDGERQKVTAQVRKGQRVTVQTEKPDAVSGHLKASNAPLEISVRGHGCGGGKQAFRHPGTPFRQTDL